MTTSLARTEDLLQKTPQELVSIIQALRRTDVAILGEGEAFVRRSPDGKVVEGFKASITLKESRKELYKVSGKMAPSADGYTRLNQIASLSIFNPETLFFNGKDQSNPYVEFSDDKNRNISFVAVRRIAFGPSPTGVLTAIDRTTLFSVYTYLLQDLQNKVKYKPDCGGYGTLQWKPEHIPEKQQGHLVPFDIESGVVLWVDIAKPEVQDCFTQHTQRCKFAERIATRICERNCLKVHPAIAVNTVEASGGQARVTVYGNRQVSYDIDKLREMGSRISSGRVVEDEVSIDAHTVEATIEDIAPEAALETDEFSPEPEPEPEAAPEPEVDAEREALLQEFSKEKKRIGPRAFVGAMQELEVTDINQLSVEEIRDVVTHLSDIRKDTGYYQKGRK